MIIVRLSGGLGNQLFQYAAGRALSIRNNCRLYLETSFYKRSPNRTLALQHFRVNGIFVSPWDVYKEMGWMLMYLPDLFRGKNRVFSDAIHQYKEHGQTFEPALFGVPTPVVLDGYWQTEKYFAEYRDLLIEELTLDVIPAGVAALHQRLGSENSVALHIRRGDYVANPMVNAIHGTCSDHYYLAAAQLMRERIEQPRFYIFSDEPAAAREWAARIGNAEAVCDLANGDTFTEFYLMQHCRHQIMANSSFSWWAAWLNRNPDKTVISPQQWFARSDYDTSDLYPASWIQLPSNHTHA